MAKDQDLLDELLRLGAGKEAKALPKGQTVGQAAEAFVDSVITDSARLLASGDVTGAAKLEAEGSVVDVVAVVDRTGSMYDTISKVLETLDRFSHELWKPGATTRMAILALEDHCGRRDYLGVDILPLTESREEIRRYLAGLRAGGGGDGIENYECGWQQAARVIAETAVPAGKIRRVVGATFMETAAHGQIADLRKEGAFVSLGERASSYLSMIWDDGCTMGQGVNWRMALAAFKAAATQFYIVDCQGRDGDSPIFQIAKRACIDPRNQNEHYVSLARALDVIPPLIVGMIEQARGPASYATFVEDLKKRDPAHAGTVAGYLGAPKIVMKR